MQSGLGEVPGHYKPFICHFRPKVMRDYPAYLMHVCVELSLGSTVCSRPTWLTICNSQVYSTCVCTCRYAVYREVCV